MSEKLRHTGLATIFNFQHSENDAYLDPFDGERKAGGQITWLLKKGDALFNKLSHASVDMCRRFRPGDRKVFESKFVALDDEHAPQRYAELPHGSGQCLNPSSQAVLTPL